MGFSEKQPIDDNEYSVPAARRPRSIEPGPEPSADPVNPVWKILIVLFGVLSIIALILSVFMLHSAIEMKNDRDNERDLMNSLIALAGGVVKGDKVDWPTGGPGRPGLPGPSGPAGPRGPSGPAGMRGPPGNADIQGNTVYGEPGIAGAQGVPGAAGGPGFPGPSGPQGARGSMGGTGATGPQGKPGFPGGRGAPGPM